MAEKRERLCSLLDRYGEALPERCREVLECRYAEDLSLGEIAENCGITRQGVRDAILRGEAELEALENALGLDRKLGEVSALVSRIAERTDDEEIKSLAAEIVSVLVGEE